MVYDTVNPVVIKFILEEAKPSTRILDVGCGTGKLGQLLKGKMDCYVAGIEIDKAAVSVASEVYDDLLVMNLEDLIDSASSFAQTEKYNFIIFGDILEHVTRPDILLDIFRGALKEDGFLIASIPNIANWMIRIRILFGNFDYAGGILDQGHLRFFTYKSARRLLENAGYKIVSVINNNETLPIRLLGRVWKSLFAFQFVFKCVKKK